jgi:hypothetical protein
MGRTQKNLHTGLTSPVELVEDAIRWPALS